MAAAADTSHSALEVEKDGLAFETGLSLLISDEMAWKDRFGLGRTGAPDPLRSLGFRGGGHCVGALSALLRGAVSRITAG